MLNINTNLSSLIAQNSLNQSTNKLNTAIERMSTGCKINHAKDNAANYSISTNMTTKIGAYQVAEDNALQGLDMINTASESLTLIEDKLMRLRALAEQASNGTYGAQSKQAINQEANAIVDEINRIYSIAEYNGIKLFDHEVQMPDDPNIPKAQYDGFIKEVVRRDTSAMTKLSSVDGTVALADGTYSISTPEEMKKLADMTNAGLVSSGDEFVLANDIDLSQYENWTPIGESYAINFFEGKFDGNSHVISGLSFKEDLAQVALFGVIKNSQIINLGIEDATIKDSHSASLLCKYVYSSVIDNCYAKSSTIVASVSACGLINDLYGGSISNCYVKDIDISSNSSHGLLGYISWGTVSDSYVDIGNNVLSSAIVGSITSGTLQNLAIISDGGLCMDNVLGVISSSGGNVTIKDCYYDNGLLYSGSEIVKNLRNANNVVIDNIQPLDAITKNISFQIDIDANDKSGITVCLGLELYGLNSLRGVGKMTPKLEHLELLDLIMQNISDKSTLFGATSNRLESVLEEITIQRDNLVSSRSTLRDADIAEVSAEYIQQQILQQASATLLATANQSPSIALQLI